MSSRYERSELLLGKESTARLRASHVAVFGLGGVGSYAVEALARAGVGELTLIDCDVYSESNLNRQLFALPRTVGVLKTDAAAARVAEIDPSITVHTVAQFMLPETVASLPFSDFDCILDAIDTVSAKIAIAQCAAREDIPMISAMGAGNKLDPTAFRVAPIEKTKGCPLARVMRTELARRGIRGVTAVYSEEPPRKSGLTDEESGKPIPGSLPFVPSVVGLIMAGEAVKRLCFSEQI